MTVFFPGKRDGGPPLVCPVDVCVEGVVCGTRWKEKEFFLKGGGVLGMDKNVGCGRSFVFTEGTSGLGTPIESLACGQEAAKKDRLPGMEYSYRRQWGIGRC